MNFCPNCGAENKTNGNYCPNCGFAFSMGVDPLPSDQRQKTVDDKNPYATQTIQTAQSSQYVSLSSDKSQTTALILSLFCLGLQYYYVGRIGAGIFHSILGLIFWSGLISNLVNRSVNFIFIYAVLIIVFIAKDAIKIGLGYFRDAARHPLKK